MSRVRCQSWKISHKVRYIKIGHASTFPDFCIPENAPEDSLFAKELSHHITFFVFPILYRAFVVILKLSHSRTIFMQNSLTASTTAATAGSFFLSACLLSALLLQQTLCFSLLSLFGLSCLLSLAQFLGVRFLAHSVRDVLSILALLYLI